MSDETMFMKRTNTQTNSNLTALNCLSAEGLSRLSFCGLLSFAVAGSAFAQDNPYVRIEMPEHAVSLEGELIDFDSEVYYIQGQLGVLRVKRTEAICIGVGCPDSEETTSSPSSARAVVLHSIDGETQISGELVTVDDTHYVIRNRLGEFNILKSNVECEGSACPNVQVYDPQFAVHGATPEVRTLVADLLRGYAVAHDQDFEIDLIDDAPEKVRILSKADQEIIAEVNLVIESPKDALEVLSDNVPDITILDQQQFNAHLHAVADVRPDDLEQALLGYDGLVIAGNRANPVRDLDALEIAGISNGSISSWRTLGGGEYPVTMHVVDDDATTGSDAQVWLSSFGQPDVGHIVRHKTEAEVLAAVELDRNAIGLVHRATASAHHAKMMDVRRSCGLTTSPTSFDMQIGQYPMTQPVYAYGRSSGMHPVAESFLTWVRSSEAQQVTARSGFVSTELQRMRMQDMGVAVIHTAAEELDFDAQEFSSMMRELRDADRLSISFRFLPGSATLDEASVQNVKDLAARLRRSEFDGQEVLLVGFADSIGPADRNTVLSARRADTVRSVLEAEFDTETLGRLNVSSLSFGEQMPLDCNETDEGRANNRRVEVWVRTAS